MGVLDFNQEDTLGTVESVDTSTVVIRVDSDEKIKGLQVNHLLAIQSPKVGQQLIGMVSKIIRKSTDTADIMDEFGTPLLSYNMIKAVLIGTHYDRDGIKENVFKRTLSTVPSVNAESYLISGQKLKDFMQAITSVSSDEESVSLDIGKYSIDEEAVAFLNGNKFFQRHAVIVGSTGSGKSWSVARILEQVAKLKSANAILFDIHGEYTPLNSDGFAHYKIAGPNDTVFADKLFLPYWLLTYEEMLSMMLDRSDSNAPNQAMLFSSEVLNQKKKHLKKCAHAEMENVITLDSPVPYDLQALIDELSKLDVQMVPGQNGKKKQGPYYGKLTRFIQRLNAKIEDKRLNFMFSQDSSLLEYEYMNDICEKLMRPSDDSNGGVKIIDFSEVPSDVLPLITSLVARVIFAVQQWSEVHMPIAIFCDEAHLYMPSSSEPSMDTQSVGSFERIAKEGRKYGVGLVVISQRPSEVNRTVLSQCNNFVAMRLTNADDQAVIKRLLPDSLGDYSEMLPILDIGEAIAVGDASILPSRIKVDAPNLKPRSATVNFWDEWSKDVSNNDIKNAVEFLRKQSKSYVEENIE
ncbi:ATP-binding protein [Streptococcus lutetiensis]|uniref:ATP-binding protein n=1 Tax=Streptococcus lutetiensis TaxID=150055 RepID=UPI001964D1A9|nr:ATP-binding protein [Streptococcus lutetiensis]